MTKSSPTVLKPVAVSSEGSWSSTALVELEHVVKSASASKRGRADCWNSQEPYTVLQRRLSAISLEVHSRSAAQLAQSWGADPRTLHALSAKAVSDRGQTRAGYKSSASSWYPSTGPWEKIQESTSRSKIRRQLELVSTCRRPAGVRSEGGNAARPGRCTNPRRI